MRSRSRARALAAASLVTASTLWFPVYVAEEADGGAGDCVGDGRELWRKMQLWCHGEFDAMTPQSPPRNAPSERTHRDTASIHGLRLARVGRKSDVLTLKRGGVDSLCKRVGLAALSPRPSRSAKFALAVYTPKWNGMLST